MGESFHNVYVCISNHHILFKYVTILFFDCTLIKLEKIKIDLKYCIRDIREYIIKVFNRNKIKWVKMWKYINK